MFNSFNHWVTSFFLFLEELKGKKTVREVRTPKDYTGQLIGYSIEGYSLTIYCHRRKFLRSYDKWFIPNSNTVIYHVYSSITNDAPEALKQACELELEVPRLLPRYFTENAQKNAVVRAYLDVLICKLKEK